MSPQAISGGSNCTVVAFGHDIGVSRLRPLRWDQRPYERAPSLCLNEEAVVGAHGKGAASEGRPPSGTGLRTSNIQN